MCEEAIKPKVTWLIVITFCPPYFWLMAKQPDFERESIMGRLLEFVAPHPPFTFLNYDQQNKLLQHSSLRYFDEGESVFEEGNPPSDNVYMIRKGGIKISDRDNGLVDHCAEGELFGARSLMEAETYQASAIASPDALVIQIPAQNIRNMLATEPKLIEYFFGDFSSGPALRKRQLSQIKSQHKSLKTQKANYTGNITISANRKPITCLENLSIKQAAQLMSEQRVGSIIITSKAEYPVGIVTDTDFRTKVATGNFSLDAPISAIMNSPVKTTQNNLSVDEYALEMLQAGVHHLCITKSGTTQSEVIGVITDHDVLVSRGGSPSILLKALKKQRDRDEVKKIVSKVNDYLKALVEADEPVTKTARLANAFNKQLLNHAIIKSSVKQSIDLKSLNFCWLALGSVARGEQIIRTDFDSAIVFEGNETHKNALKKLANGVFEELVYYGYESDKAGIQANNPEWINTKNEWKAKFNSWIKEPTQDALLHSTIFFDLMPFYGEEKLSIELQEHIYKSFKGHKGFTGFLAGNALQNPPPLGFFGNLVLEKSGEHKNSFDLKARAMMPLADAARLLALEHNLLYPSNTIERFERLCKLNDVFSERYEDCATAYEIFLKTRATHGFENNNDGRYLNLNNLSSLEKQLLKNAFRPIAEIQNQIKPANGLV
ncbi:MAG: cyclic nucleotide-binding domain-containing protein [Bacteroidia bacterium]